VSLIFYFSSLALAEGNASAAT